MATNGAATERNAERRPIRTAYADRTAASSARSPSPSERHRASSSELHRRPRSAAQLRSDGEHSATKCGATALAPTEAKLEDIRRGDRSRRTARIRALSAVHDSTQHDHEACLVCRDIRSWMRAETSGSRPPTGSTPVTSAPGLRDPLSHLHQDSADGSVAQPMPSRPFSPQPPALLIQARVPSDWEESHRAVRQRAQLVDRPARPAAPVLRIAPTAGSAMPNRASPRALSQTKATEVDERSRSDDRFAQMRAVAEQWRARAVTAEQRLRELSRPAVVESDAPVRVSGELIAAVDAAVDAMRYIGIEPLVSEGGGTDGSRDGAAVTGAVGAAGGAHGVYLESAGQARAACACDRLVQPPAAWRSTLACACVLACVLQ